jgi:hypothetical protein
MEQKQEQSFIICPDCLGTGLNENNFPCKNCDGLGLGSFFEGEFLFWGLKISRANIFLRKVKHFLNFLLDLFAFIIFIGGLGSLFFWIWQDKQSNLLKSVLFFWQEKNGLILFFWTSLLALMFLIYRTSKKTLDEARIKEIKLKKIENFANNWDELRHFKHRVDISRSFREKTLMVAEDAYLLALKLKNPEVTPLHLFSSLLKSVKIAVLFTRLNVSGRDLVDRLNSQLAALPATLKKESDLRISNDVKESFISGFIEAYAFKQDNTTAINLLMPCLERSEVLREILLDLKITENKLHNTIAWFRINEQQVANYKLYRKLAGLKPRSTMDRAYTAVATPLLNNFGYDLTLAAKWGRLSILR